MALIDDFPKTEDCVELQKQVEKLLSLQLYYASNFLDLTELKPFLADKKKQMVNLQCDKKLVANKGAMIDYYVNKYSAVDKDRIEPDSIKQARTRIYVGVGILIVGFGLFISAISKK